ncbi:MULTISPECIES: pimeloyl-ACP methyl ester esterase BioH [Thiomicrorhabdus]|uniref:Pimeloyl-[acyl-carrier protein] methyl ester esterase n=1 Tax=Thiomicrorhabdus heinhorstiae TaxID=2748010 RepID=A0ABS0BWJ6_9GAMM|nr:MULTISPECIES: pimeloyl-ACP methyl ester esterase BioH [Thiomicrorhabdus]MBF6057440.1 pimeloyl-ACP methyl ester esterase BioH [Thiomicrorhabdus heinhorstiae]
MLHVDQFGTGPDLTLIHGWGAQNAVWLPWARDYLGQSFRVTLIELPGFGQSPVLEDSEQTEQDWLNAILQVMPARTHLLGWSLGGLLAQRIALQTPDRVESLICLASTPRFTQTDQWRWAVSPSLLGDFMHAIQADTLATLKHFWKLQIQGSDGARQLIRQFTQRMQDNKMPAMKGLIQGLKLLKEIDCRPQAQDIQCPVLWLLGEKDPLIPQEFIAEFSKIQPFAKTNIIHGAAHMPFLSHPQQTADAITAFIFKDGETTYSSE